MPDDPLEQVLRLVAEGRLTAEQAAPILDALDGAGRATAAAANATARAADAAARAADAASFAGSPGAVPHPFDPDVPSPPQPPGVRGAPRPGEPRFARVEVRDGGRTSVNLRVPLSLGRQALGLVPGLSLRQLSEITEAVSRGLTGPIVDIQDEAGDGVRIVLE